MTDELRAEFAALKGEIAALGVKLKPRRNLSVSQPGSQAAKGEL